MKRKRFKAEEIVNRLREPDVLIAQGQTVAQTCEQIGVTEQKHPRTPGASARSTRPAWSLPVQSTACGRVDP